MGNKLEEKIDQKLKKYMTPRADEINFPEITKNPNIKIKVKTTQNKTKFDKNRWIAKCICLLQSGNILVGIDKFDKDTYKLKSSLHIYTYPNLILEQKYIFPNERSGSYNTSVVLQLKNGKIFVIRDKLYEFEGDAIEKGPIKTSEKLNSCMKDQNYILPDQFNHYKTITKQLFYFNGKDFFEAIDGKILFKTYTNIDFFDSIKLDVNPTTLLSEDAYDIICFQSEYYIDHIYVCKNTYSYAERKKAASLSVYDIKDFCDEKNKNKTPLFSIEVSKSENILGYCEYNEKYLLLDTLSKGVYIIDMETKSKVAICDGKVAETYKEPSYTYGKMVKLDDGHIVRMYALLKIIDIRKSDVVDSFIESSRSFIQIGNSIVLLYDTSLMKVVEFSE